MTATVVRMEPARLAEALAAVRATVAAVDAAASRFREDSELTAVNRSPGTWMSLSPLATELVEVALRAAEQSDGAVDPTLGAPLRALGYDRDFELVGAGPKVSVRWTGPRWREVELDPARQRIRVPDGVELDLGATAKACAADRAARAVHQLLDGPVLVGIGGDIAVAGCAGRRSFPVRVAEDHRAIDGPVVWVGDGGVATSTTRLRRWTRHGRTHHHLLDPWTGLPAVSPVRTVTAAGGSCLDANTATTATIVLGERGPGWLAGTGLPARLVAEGGDVRTVNGWPREEEGTC